jgi:hypothetical protein
MDGKPLTPQELALQSEGESLLQKLTKDKPPVIVGADGQPVQSKPAVVEGALGAEQAKAIEETKRKIKENADKLNELIDSDKNVRDCSTAMLHAWRLLYWLSMELGSTEEMKSELITQLSDSMRASALSQGFSVADLVAGLKHRVIPFMQERVRHYTAEQTRRKKKLEAINRGLRGKGLALPCQSLKALFPKEPFFSPGDMLVLHGAQEAVRAALKACSTEHLTHNGGKPYYLSAVEGEAAGEWAHVIMPPAWWRDGASEVVKLEGVLQPVLDEGAAMVLVENLEMLSPLHPNTPQARKARALGRLRQWGFEHMSAIIVGDVTDEDALDLRVYGALPHVAVAVQELDGKRQLVIGNDVLEIKD